MTYLTTEIYIMQQWCKSNIRELFIWYCYGGSAIFRFGSYTISTKTMRETAALEDFISRLEMENYIVRNKLSRQGHWSYKLTLKAMNTFNIE